MSAIDSDADTALAPAPTRNIVDAVSASTRILASMKKPPETIAAHMMATSPRLFSSMPPTPAPTRSTSAAATPSG